MLNLTPSSSPVNLGTPIFKGPASFPLSSASATAILSKMQSAVKAIFHATYSGAGSLMSAVTKQESWKGIASVQWDKSKVNFNHAGIAGFAAFALLAAISVSVYKSMTKTTAEKGPNGSSSSTSTSQVSENTFQILCRKYPKEAIKQLQDPQNEVTTMEDQQSLLRSIFNGVSEDIGDRRNDEVKPATLNQVRAVLVEAFFTKYPNIDPKFVDSLLALFTTRFGDEEDKFSVFSATIDHCPRIENCLGEALNKAIDWSYTSFIEKILTKAPHLKKLLSSILEMVTIKGNLELSDWIISTYKKEMTTADLCVVLKKLLVKNISEKEPVSFAFFQKLVKENPELSGPEMNMMLKMAADANMEMFLIAFEGFTKLTRANFKEILEDNKSSADVLKLINEKYPINGEPNTPCPFVGTNTIPRGVMHILNELFEGSTYSVEALPLHMSNAPVGQREKTQPSREWMENPIEKGIYRDGTAITYNPYIIFRVVCTSTEQELVELGVKLGVRMENYKREKFIALGASNRKDQLSWEQLRTTEPADPLFFKAELIGSGDQATHFKEFIKTGEGKDLNGLTWRLE